jgi:hypothetical protein
MAGWMDVCHDWHSYAIIGLWSPWGLQVNERGHLTAVERVTIDLPPELKYWLDKQVQERKARGDRKASLRAVVVEMLARIPHIKVVLVVLPCVNVPLEMEMSDPTMMVWEAPHG